MHCSASAALIAWIRRHRSGESQNVRADGSPVRVLADLGDDPVLRKVGQEESDSAEVEVAPEVRPDPLGLFLFGAANTRASW